MTIPRSIDRRMIQSYLGDHLSGATAGRARAHKMAEWYGDTELGEDLNRIAEELDEEHEHLADLIDQLGLHQPLPMRLLARAGELIGRVKPNGRILSSTPTTPVLELELFRGAVNAKQGLWEVLATHSDQLGLDRARYDRLTQNADEQARVLTNLHATIRDRAFRPQD